MEAFPLPNCSWNRNYYPKNSVLVVEFFDHGRTDITHLDLVLDHFGAAMVAISQKFRFEAKSQLILSRTCFGTGPDGNLPTKSVLTGFQKFRIISTPRSGVPVLVFASSKTHAGNNYFSLKYSSFEFNVTCDRYRYDFIM